MDDKEEPLSGLARALRASWSRSTCDPVDLAAWSPARPSTGQCAVTALVVQDHLGGDLLLAEVHHADGRRQGVHYWNRLGDGREIDLTRDQFQAGEVVGEPHVEARPADTSSGRLAAQYARLRAAVAERLPRGSASADHVDALRHRSTARLQLNAVCDGDVDTLHELYSDPRGWEHAPAGRHSTRAQTEEVVRAAEQQWKRDGLAYWVAREHSGGMVGTGGARRDVDGAWNLYWHLSHGARGRGYAVELGRAAISAARTVDPGASIVARMRPAHAASRRVAERLGLIEQVERRDSDGVVRVAYLAISSAGHPSCSHQGNFARPQQVFRAHSTERRL